MNKPISNHRSNSDLCPVHAWQQIVSILHSQHPSISSIPVNHFSDKPIAATEIKDWIRRGAKKNRKLHPQISISSFGTHSIRCGAALTMYLSRTSIIDIMLQGRWSSDAFLLYIRKAVLELSEGISSGIIQYESLTQLPQQSSLPPLNRTNTSSSFGSSNATSYILAPNFHLNY